jgi:putative flippase GtrA
LGNLVLCITPGLQSTRFAQTGVLAVLVAFGTLWRLDERAG